MSDLITADLTGPPVYRGYDRAELDRQYGVKTVVPNFALAPHHEMDEIVRQNRSVIDWLWRHAREFGGDPSRIYVGGHLATMLLATEWPSVAAGLPKKLGKGACAISALFDMEPIRLSYLNDTRGS